MKFCPSAPAIMVGLFATVLCGAAYPALAQTVSLDPIVLATPDGGKVTLSKVEASDTNLSKDEWAKLFAKDTPSSEKRAIAEKARRAG